MLPGGSSLLGGCLCLSGKAVGWKIRLRGGGVGRQCMRRTECRQGKARRVARGRAAVVGGPGGVAGPG